MLKITSLLSGSLFAVLLNGSVHAETVLINGPEVDLTLEDVVKTLSTVNPLQRAGLEGSPKKLRGVIDSTYITKVLANRARQNNLQNDPEVAAEIWHKTQNILAAAQAQKVLKDALSQVKDREAAAKEIYLVSKDQYKTAEEVEASHILLKEEEGKTDKDVLAEAKRIREDIVAGNITFEDAAEKYSADKGSAARKGSLGKFGKDRMVKSFETAVFALENPGDMSEPVKSRFGYHLIRLDAKYPAVQKSFDEVKEEIINGLIAKQGKEVRESYLIDIRDDPKVKLDQPAIDAFLANPGTLK